jgi:hypothetical protein
MTRQDKTLITTTICGGDCMLGDNVIPLTIKGPIQCLAAALAGVAHDPHCSDDAVPLIRSQGAYLV